LKIIKVEMECTDPIEIQAKVKDALQTKGIRTIRSIGRTFTPAEHETGRKLDKQDFYWGLQDLGASITMREAG
jgi:hypothetical protein